MAQSATNVLRYVAFGEVDGMLSAETHGKHQPTAWKARDGRLWFSTDRGVTVIDPRRVQENNVPPPVVIEKVLADDRTILSDVDLSAGSKNGGIGNPQDSTGNSQMEPPGTESPVRLAPGRARVLEIHYTANSFAAPGKIRFKYRLDNYDQDWRDDLENRRLALYTNLRPGNYRFQVKACNNHGVWNDVGASFAFYLAPHFYETWPFYAVCALLTLGAAAGVQAYRLNVQRQMLRLEQQASMERERTRIAQDMHDDLGANLTKIAIMTEVARKNPSLPGGVGNQLQQVSEMARNVVDSITEIIWAVNPRHDRLENLCAYLREYTSQALEPTSIRCRIQFPEQIPSIPLSAEMRRNIFLVIKEALHNITKHSQARNARLDLSLITPPPALSNASNSAPHLEIIVADDGCGFDISGPTKRGDGLRNMTNRIATLGGVFEIESKPGAGTTVRLHVPLITPR